MHLTELEATIDPEDLTDQRMLHAATGHCLVYHSEPAVEPLVIAGFFRLHLWLTLDVPDTDIRADVHDVAPDGTSVRLTSDWMRARYRTSEAEPNLVESGEVLEYRFESFMFVARGLSAGHRLRLVVGPMDSIHWQRNYQGGGVVADETIADARVATVRLYHDDDRPSRLIVPIGADANAACDA